MVKFSRRLNPLSLIVVLAIALWSVSIGWGITHALEPIAQLTNEDNPRFEAGRTMYVETCGTCHIAIPPEVLPIETWKKLLEKPNDHYGTSVPNLIRLSQLLIWDYVKTFSRPLSTDEPAPFYVAQSRYFKALHPKVKFAEPISNKSCIICHPGVKDFEFRSLTPEWDNSP